MTRQFLASLALAVVAASTPAAHAGLLYGVTTTNNLVSFDSSTPGSIQSSNAVTGTVGNEILGGIDFRPATGMLYGINTTGTRIYLIDVLTGSASQVGADSAVTLSTSGGYGIDFNPTVDRIRVTDAGGTDANLRYRPDTGALVSTDTSLAYAAGDANAGADPNIAGVAYINNDNDPLTGTTLYGIDGLQNVLVTIIPPNAGSLNTVGALGINAAGLIGFDVDAAGSAFLSSGAGGSSLYSINLNTGAATLIGGIGRSLSLRGLSAALPNTPIRVPEPAALALLGIGLLGALRRKHG